MSLLFVIDGYNIINHPSFIQSVNKRNDNPRLLLSRLITSRKLTGSPKNQAVLVFDGFANTGDMCLKEEAGNIRVVFSENESADEKIKQIIERAKNPKNICVVTDDKDILFFARLKGAALISAADFIGLKEERQKKKERMPEVELTYSQKQRIDEEMKRVWLKDGRKEGK